MLQSADQETLLQRFKDRRDESAFAALVRGNLEMVYSAAVRRVGDRHMAEDVTQAVFVILAQKAKSIHDNRALSAWLLRAVRYAAANAAKIEARRRRHEQAAQRVRAQSGLGACSSNPTDVLVWQEMAQHLDDAVLKLPAADRQAILLRYFQGRHIADVASALKVTEGAAKQRLSRALDKLRQRLSPHGGLASAIDATALASLLASQALLPAPAGLSNAALAAAAGGASASAGISIAKGAITMMTWAKAKAVAAVVVGVTVIGGAGGVAIKSAVAQEKRQPVPVAAAKPAQAAKAKKDAVSLQAAPPVVVKTIPQAGASDIDPGITEIQVTYSKDMTDGTWSWSTWGEEHFPQTTGKPHYLEDKRTCVLPVRLKPGMTYAIWLNSSNFGNFKDSDGQRAVPYLLVFETRK